MNPIYISKLYVEKFKSLQQTEITLNSGLNIIIGKNGSGKSNLLAFLYNALNTYRLNDRLNSSLAYKINGQQSFTKINWELDVKINKLDTTRLSQKNQHVLIKLSYLKNKIETSLEFDTDENKINTVNFKQFQKNRHEILLFKSNLFNDLISFNIPTLLNYLTLPVTISVNKDNIFESETFAHFKDFSVNDIRYSEWLSSKLINNLTPSIQKFRKSEDIGELKTVIVNHIESSFSHENLLENLSYYSPIHGLRINPNFSIYKKGDEVIIDNLRIEFLINEEWLPWQQLSDGTKRLFIILSTITHSYQNIILIEEPELGIYPDQLFLLLNFIKEQAKRKQIIITTHSPMVLDILEPSELNKINICYMTEKGTRFKKLNRQQKQKAKQYMQETNSLSNYWLHSDLM